MPSIFFGKSMIVAGLLAMSAASAQADEAFSGRWQLTSAPAGPTLQAIDVAQKNGQWIVTEVAPDKTCGKIFARVEAPQKADADGRAPLSGRATDDSGRERRVHLAQEKGSLRLMVEGDHAITMRSIPFLTRRYVRTGPSQCAAPTS